MVNELRTMDKFFINPLDHPSEGLFAASLVARVFSDEPVVSIPLWCSAASGRVVFVGLPCDDAAERRLEAVLDYAEVIGEDVGVVHVLVDTEGSSHNFSLHKIIDFSNDPETPVANSLCSFFSYGVQKYNRLLQSRYSRP